MRLQSSTFKRYLIAYISIAVTACAIVGVVLYSSAIQQIAIETRRAEQERLSVACTDFSRQIETMENLALRIKTAKEFQPSVMALNPISKIELLESFKQLQNYSPLLTHYFLFYEDDDCVFSLNGEVPFYLFANMVLPSQSTNDLRETIESGIPVFNLTGHPETVYMNFPIQFRYQNTYSKANLIISIDRSILVRRYTDLYNLSSDLQFEYNGYLLFPDYSFSNGSSPIEEAYVKNICIRMFPTEEDRTLVFSQNTLFALLIISLALSVIAGYMAYRNYLPIKKLAKRINTGIENNNNELEAIEFTINALNDEKNSNGQQLAESFERIALLTDSLQQQIVLNIIDGKIDEKQKEHISNAGMMLRRPFLCALYSPYGENILEVRKYINDTHSSEAVVYAACLPGKRGIVAVVAANSAEDLDLFCNICRDAVYAAGYDNQIFKGKTVYSIDEIPFSIQDAEQCTNNSPKEVIDIITEQSSFQILRTAIIQDKTEEAIQIVSDIIDDINANHSSLLIRQYYLMNFINNLMGIDKECNERLSDYNISPLLLTEDDATIKEQIVSLIRIITSKNEQDKDTTRINEKAKQVLTFIRNNALFYSMCLDYVANECQLSTKQIGRIVKINTGMTFTAYLLQIRMDEAISLLESGIHPAEVTQKVGYQDERYFKERFRSYTGKSATEYYRNGRKSDS